MLIRRERRRIVPPHRLNCVVPFSELKLCENLEERDVKGDRRLVEPQKSLEDYLDIVFKTQFKDWK